jgi:hypothetical protein
MEIETMSKDELKADELAFIDEYMICMNGVQAYLIVHPRSSYGAARTNASRLLSKVTVKEEIKKRMKEHAMSANEILARLTAMAQGTLFPFVKVDGDGHIFYNFNHPEAKKYMFLIRKLKSRKHEIAREKSSSVEKWIEVELHDAMKALELLGKYHALFTEKIEQTGRKVIHVTIDKRNG